MFSSKTDSSVTGPKTRGPASVRSSRRPATAGSVRGPARSSYAQSNAGSVSRPAAARRGSVSNGSVAGPTSRPAATSRAGSISRPAAARRGVNGSVAGPTRRTTVASRAGSISRATPALRGSNGSVAGPSRRPASSIAGSRRHLDSTAASVRTSTTLTSRLSTAHESAPTYTALQLRAQGKLGVSFLANSAAMLASQLSSKFAVKLDSATSKWPTTKVERSHPTSGVAQNSFGLLFDQSALSTQMLSEAALSSVGLAVNLQDEPSLETESLGLQAAISLLLALQAKHYIEKSYGCSLPIYLLNHRTDSKTELTEITPTPEYIQSMLDTLIRRSAILSDGSSTFNLLSSFQSDPEAYRSTLRLFCTSLGTAPVSIDINALFELTAEVTEQAQAQHVFLTHFNKAMQTANLNSHWHWDEQAGQTVLQCTLTAGMDVATAGSLVTAMGLGDSFSATTDTLQVAVTNPLSLAPRIESFRRLLKERQTIVAQAPTLGYTSIEISWPNPSIGGFSLSCTVPASHATQAARWASANGAHFDGTSMSVDGCTLQKFTDMHKVLSQTTPPAAPGTMSPSARAAASIRVRSARAEMNPASPPAAPGRKLLGTPGGSSPRLFGKGSPAKSSSELVEAARGLLEKAGLSPSKGSRR